MGLGGVARECNKHWVERDDIQNNNSTRCFFNYLSPEEPHCMYNNINLIVFFCVLCVYIIHILNVLSY